jgi:hypothetical protein
MDTLSCQFIVDREEKLEAKSSLRLEAVLQNGRRRALNLTVVKGGPSDGELSMPPTITLDQGKGFAASCVRPAPSPFVSPLNTIRLPPISTRHAKEGNTP